MPNLRPAAAAARHPRGARLRRPPKHGATRCVGAAATLLAALLAAGGVPARAALAGLDAAVQASWTGVPLRVWAERAAAIAGMPVVVDRRLDPDTLVTRACGGESLGDVLGAVAADAGAELEVLRSTVRLVPRDAAGLAANAERLRLARDGRLPAATRRALAVRRPWRWAEAAAPRALVADALAEARLAIDGLERIPHDHFPAADLPPLSLAERLELVLAHFDLAIDWRTEGAGVAGTVVAIRSLPVVPAAAAEPARPERRPPGGRTVQVRDAYTLRLEAPLDQALAAIAGRLGLTLDLERAALTARGIAPGEIVRAEVREASREELLDAVLGPLGLGWTIDGRTLRVGAPAAATPRGAD